jgi:gluconate kinase
MLPDLSGWLPIRLYWQHGQPMLDWCYLGERRLTEPFFDQTIDVALRQPFNLLFRHQTPLATLAELHERERGLPPSGFVFHVSRCGSTLVAQTLAALPQNIVVAEAGPIDGVLQAQRQDSAISDEQRMTWLRWMVGAFGRTRIGQERHLVIKFDSWHTRDLPLIRRAFPTVPWIFVYRDPVEVLVSHQRMPGIQMVPGLVDPRAFALDPATVFTLPHLEYRARVLASIYQAAIEHTPALGGMLVPYHGLPGAIWESLLHHFKLDYSAADIEQMREAAQRNAKSPTLPFADDTGSKQQDASNEIRSLSDRWVRPLYTQLETLYREQNG